MKKKGHEFVGKVIQLHPTASQSLHDQWMNQRVCGDINIGCCNFSSSASSDNNTNSDDDEAIANTTKNCGICTNTTLNYNNFSNNNSQMSRNHCPNRTVLGILNQNGTFCEYMIIPISNLHVVPDSIGDDIAVFAEPLAAACRVVEQGFVNFSYGSKEEECCLGGGGGASGDGESSGVAHEERRGGGGDRVAILGDGKLGLCIAEILGRNYLKAVTNDDDGRGGGGVSPHPPILFGKHQHKLDLVRDSGVDRRLVKECYTNEDMEKGEISSSRHVNKYDVVIDSTGNPNGLTLAMQLCRPMGRLVLKSTCAAGVKGFNSAPIVVDELQVVGSRCGPIDVALDLLANASPPLRMEKYITETFPLSRVRDALECAAKKSTMKVQLVMGTEEGDGEEGKESQMYRAFIGENLSSGERKKVFY